VIVWDPATKMETFIRRAGFVSTAKSFGFLVPTPTQPALAETQLSTEGFEWSVRPRLVTETKGISIDPTPLSCECVAATSKSERDTAAASVRVLQTAHVAGFDATTLAADDPALLAGWLDHHGYATTPELTAWLAWYVDHRWVITAFVISSDDTGTHDIATKNVKMTFQTDRPFYPYREPATAKPLPQRLLRVWFFAPDRVAATTAGTPWVAKTLWSGAYVPATTEESALLGAHTHLTMFDDTSAPRRGTDEVYFAKSADQSDVEQPPVVHVEPRTISVPLDLVVISAVIVLVFVRRRRRVRQA
jgi:Uncharacterized protein conserved in bacteria (DUF2330)